MNCMQSVFLIAAHKALNDWILLHAFQPQAKKKYNIIHFSQRFIVRNNFCLIFFLFIFLLVVVFVCAFVCVRVWVSVENNCEFNFSAAIVRTQRHRHETTLNWYSLTSLWVYHSIAVSIYISDSCSVRTQEEMSISEDGNNYYSNRSAGFNAHLFVCAYFRNRILKLWPIKIVYSYKSALAVEAMPI